ncbi:MAG: hypothetical protein QOI66_1569, partial [Myxococcales bacterium]|nr:hypothetical protein [Myxococcales bacterium]
LEGLYQSVEGPKPELDVREGEGFCDACFSNRYPIAAEPPQRLRQLRLINA